MEPIERGSKLFRLCGEFRRNIGKYQNKINESFSIINERIHEHIGVNRKFLIDLLRLAAVEMSAGFSIKQLFLVGANTNKDISPGPLLTQEHRLYKKLISMTPITGFSDRCQSNKYYFEIDFLSTFLQLKFSTLC